MDTVSKGASPEYVLQCIKWCAENEKINALEAHIRQHKEKLKDELMPVLQDAMYKNRTRVVGTMLSVLDQEFRTAYNTGEKGEKLWPQKLFLDALLHGDTEIVIDLIDKGANVNETYNKKPVLHLAACYGYSEIVEELVKAGCDVNCFDSRGEGIIHSILSWSLVNKVKMIILLINLGADPLVKSSCGKLPIHVAAKNSPDVLTMFIQDGQDVNIPDDVNKDTPIHIACGTACPETILTLIQGGCKFNTENVQGQTPLAKLLRFTNSGQDFHAKTRLNIAKRLISIGFRMSKQNDKAIVKIKGRDKCYDRYMSLKMSLKTPRSLQNITRVTVRGLLSSGTNLRNEIDRLPIPINLKSYILFCDLKSL